MNALIGLIVLFAVAIIGWAIAEMKYKTFTFTRSEKDVEEEELLENEHRAQEWRANFMKKHTLIGMISLPDELFYPNASAITTIMIAKAHVPQPEDSEIFMGRIDNDGYIKQKGKRIECEGNQIPEMLCELKR